MKSGLAFVTLCFLIAPATGYGSLLYTGVNLSGAEFGTTPTPTSFGTYNTDYTYPTSAEVDYYVGKGMNNFRLPFRWERLQRSANAALDTAELARMDTFVNTATTKGAYVELDPHNFARYFPSPSNFQGDTTRVIGGTNVPASVFADFWSRVATHYKNNPHVIFNLMNEPANMSTTQWVSDANAAIAAIRAAGATNLIEVPGNRFTGAWTWNTSGGSNGASNATAMLSIVDPGNNFVIEAHQYFDTDGSGTHSTIDSNNVNIGPDRLAFLTSWLRTNHLKADLGEFAIANSIIGTDPSQIGDEVLTNLLNYLDANSDVWVGWNWWGGGPWWGNYMFGLDPTSAGDDQPAMALLSPHAVGVPEPTAGGMLLAAAVALGLRRSRRA